MNIVLIGFAGSGKGTQAEILCKRLGIPCISIGQMLRAEVSRGSKLGKMADEYMSKGSLIPDDIIMDIVRKRITQKDCDNGFIFDGFPRNVKQAELLERLMKELSKKIDIVIKIKAGKEVVMKRILGRYSCRECETIYNEFFAPTKKKGICDVCGGTDFKYRKDDSSQEAVNRRLDIYAERTRPVIDFYKKSDLIYSVDGVKNIEEVSSDIKELITKRIISNR